MVGPPLIVRQDQLETIVSLLTQAVEATFGAPRLTD
jgi:hypothetical protein